MPWLLHQQNIHHPTSPYTNTHSQYRQMDPSQLLAALASACPPQSSREALVLACHAACLLQNLVPLSSSSSSSSSSTSLLNAFHESAEGVYPTQGFAVQVLRACQEGQGQGKAEGEEDHLYIKPVGHGPCNDGNDEGEDEENEAILVLFGRRPGLSEAAVHRLELGVRDYILPSTRGAGKTEEEDGKEGRIAEVEKTVLIPGGSRQGRQGNVSSSSSHACRFDALAARLATHFLSKLRPELYAAQQLPSFSDVMRTDGSPTPSSSSSPPCSPSLLLNELLPLLSCPSMLRLAATARQYQRSLAQEERAWKALLQRDFPAAAASLASSSPTTSSNTTTTTTVASSSSSSSSGSNSSNTPSSPPPVHRVSENARALYRRLLLARPRSLPSSRRIYHPDDWEIPFCHLPPSHHHPHYPFLPPPLYYLPGGLGGGRARGRRGAGEAGPRYMPAFGAPPLWFPGRGQGGREWEDFDDGVMFWR